MAIYTVMIFLLLSILTVFDLSSSFDLTIVHTNDIHGRIEQFDAGTAFCSEESATAQVCFGGVARIQTAVNQVRAEVDNVLLLDGGDQFQGTSWFHYYQGDAAAHFMNRLGYDVMTIGNHEFDLGTEVLARFLQNVDFTVVSANVDVSNETVLQGLFTKSTIKEVDGERIGIVGYTYRETPILSHAEVGNTVFESEIETVQKEVDKLVAQGVNKIIALGHSGIVKDVEVAAKVKGVDIVVGGHTDTFLYTGTPPSTEFPYGEYPTIVTQDHDSTKQVLVVHDYAYGKYLGRLNVVFDAEGKVVEFSGNPILLDGTIEQDPDILADIAVWGVPVRSVSHKVIGSSNVFLDGSYEVCCIRECNAGNLITDAYVRAYVPAQGSDKGWTNVSIAIEACGNIRASILSGDLVVEDIVGVLPFQLTIDTVDMYGGGLRFLLESTVANFDPLEGIFLQISGLIVTYDLSKAPFTRVVDVLVLCSDCVVPEFEPLDDGKIYRIAIPSYLVMFVAELVLDHQTGTQLDTTVVTEYIEQFSPIVSRLERRIIFIEQPSTNPPPTKPPKLPKYPRKPSQEKMRKHSK